MAFLPPFFACPCGSSGGVGDLGRGRESEQRAALRSHTGDVGAVGDVRAAGLGDRLDAQAVLGLAGHAHHHFGNTQPDLGHAVLVHARGGCASQAELQDRDVVVSLGAHRGRLLHHVVGLEGHSTGEHDLLGVE